MLQKPTVAFALGELPRAFGSLTLLKLLGREARGEVFLAMRAEGADRLCVVTLLAPSLTANRAVRDGLRAQANWLVGRVHGNLVQIYDVGHAGDQVFLVSEFVEGADLGATLTRAGPFDPGLAVFAALEIGEALVFVRAHEEQATGIAACTAGLSAASVLLARGGQIKLLHHGSSLAPPADASRAPEAAVVSLLPPEHVRGGGSSQGDVFAVGALLWQMLTGRPLAGEGAAAHLTRLRAGTFAPRAPSTVLGPARALPQGIDRLVTAALAPRPEDRPRGFEALRAELVAAKRSLPGSDQRAVRRLMSEAFGAELSAQGKDVARLMAAATETPGLSPRQPALTLTDISGLRRPSSAKTELRLGEVIPGTRYRALERLGEGGMGTVYRAEHVDIERQVALKLLHAELVENPHVLRQFRQEARAASRIGNPFICDVTDWGEVEDGRVFFVMEYLDGVSLAQVLKERPLPSERVIPILRQVAKALGAAHEKGIVHLDVKPDNVILFDKNGHSDAVKVVDFGVAGLLGQAGGGAKVMGTPEYMAPERAQGLGYDHRSDIYSLGVMAYEMLAGEVPFQGASAVDTLAMHVDERPAGINQRISEAVPPALEAVVLRMLQKDPARRPQTMAEVETLLIEAQIEARLRTVWDEELTLPPMDADRAMRIARKLSPLVRRTRLLLALASSVAAVSVTIAIYFAVRDSGPSPGRQEIADDRAATEPAPRPHVVPVPAMGLAESPPLPPAARPGPTPEGLKAKVSQEPALAQGHRKRPAPLARDPARARAAVARGTQALAAGRIAQAANDFSEAVEADPHNVQALAGHAEAEFENARYESALRSARVAARLAPRAPKHHVLLGDAHYKLGQYQQALRAYQRALSLAPQDSSIQASIERVTAKLPGAP
jgi:serine/threonine protein kinase